MLRPWFLENFLTSCPQVAQGRDMGQGVVVSMMPGELSLTPSPKWELS